MPYQSISIHGSCLDHDLKSVLKNYEEIREILALSWDKIYRWYSGRILPKNQSGGLFIKTTDHELITFRARW